jgi:predicted Zn-dependent protease with MMP-like domain
VISLDHFDELAAQALDALPAWIRERMENVEIVIEERPPDRQPSLLGLYEGIPLTRRGLGYYGVVPDRITLFRTTLETLAEGDDARLRRLITHTVAHEVAHHFGISDDRLREIGRY